MEDKLNRIARQFQIQGEISSIKPLGEGFINDTYYLSTAKESDPDYLFQRKNKQIFTDVPAMMENILKVTTHLKNKISALSGDPDREAMTLIRTHSSALYQLDEENEYWTMCLFIKDSITYESAETPALAYSGGKGIGKFQRLCSDFEGRLSDILPGFHNIRFRFEQWDKTLNSDPVQRKESVAKEIEWIESRRDEMLRFWSLYENGIIPTRVTHNDTKINNILFDVEGDVLCMVDLDTVLSSTALNDFGDAIRSYTNTGYEDDKNLHNVSMDLEIYTAYAKGYLEETRSFLTKAEIDHLAFSAKYITFEQILRFLMDYIDGDNYYKTKYENHNLVRARAQYKLLRSMEEQFEQMQATILTNI